MNEPNRFRAGQLLSAFALLFVAVGFVLGTAAVLGPLNWVGTEAVAGSSGLLGGTAIGVMFLLYLTVTLLMTRVIMRRVLYGRRPVRLAIAATVAVLMIASFGGWMARSEVAAADAGMPDHEVRYSERSEAVSGDIPEIRPPITPDHAAE